MTGPNDCKYCGCKEVATKTDCEIVFRCWSSYVVEDDYWTVSNNCGARCAVQLVEMRGKVQRAVKVLERAARYDFIASYMPHMDKRSDGDFLEYEQAEQVIEILKGETDGQTK